MIQESDCGVGVEGKVSAGCGGWGAAGRGGVGAGGGAAVRGLLCLLAGVSFALDTQL